MNEYEKIIKIVVENVSARKMMEEDAITILIGLCNDAPGSLPESLLKQATTLSYGEDEKNA